MIFPRVSWLHAVLFTVLVFCFALGLMFAELGGGAGSAPSKCAPGTVPLAIVVPVWPVADLVCSSNVSCLVKVWRSYHISETV